MSDEGRLEKLADTGKNDVLRLTVSLMASLQVFVADGVCGALQRSKKILQCTGF